MKDNYVKKSANRWMMFIPLLILLIGSLVSINIAYANNLLAVDAAPVIENFSPPATAQVGQLYSYQVQASGGITYTLNNAPDFMSINGTGLISWTPTFTQTGTHSNIEVFVDNNEGSASSGPFSVQVNEAPQITSAEPTHFAVVGEEYTHTVTASGEPVPNLSIDLPKPSGMLIGSSSGVITWTPASLGDEEITVRASNGINPDATQTFTIPVYEKPVISTTAVTEGVVGVQYQYDVDSTGYPAPTFSLIQKPSGMNINPTTGEITWTPGSLGSEDVTVRASNTAGDNDQSFTIQVGELPQINSIPSAQITVGESFAFTAVASGTPAPTFSLQTAPSGMTINPTTGEISWTSSEPFIGKNPVTVVVTNDFGSDSRSFNVYVLSAAICLNNTISHWPSDAIVSNQSEDITWSNNGTCSGATCPASVPGKVNNALDFDGNNDGLDIVPPSNLTWEDNDNFTIQAWVNTTQACQGDANKVIVGGFQTGNKGEFWWLGCGVGANEAVFQIRARGLNQSAHKLRGVTAINDGQWHHLAVVRNGVTKAYTLYVDGKAEASETVNYVTVINNNAPLYIGYFGTIHPVDYYFDGLIDEISIQSVALTPEDIAQYALNVGANIPACSDTAVAPNIISSPPLIAPGGGTYTYQLKATGLPVPTYALGTTYPSGMNVDSQTGLVTWFVDESLINTTVDIELEASNSADTVTQSFAVEVLKTFFIYLPTIQR